MGIPLLWNNWLLPRLHLGPRGRTAANAAFATAYAAAFRTRRPCDERDSDSGTVDYASSMPVSTVRGDRYATLRTPFGDRGLRCGSVLFAAVCLGYCTALAIPSLRIRLSEFADRAPEVGLVEWAGVHIPIGTVYSEELIFRDTLDPLLDDTFGTYGIWLGATAFGLWHIAPARAAGDNVPATVSATTLAGLLLGGLRRHTGSVIAPALVHLAVNAGGAIAPRIARRTRGPA
ncbi:CPBP family intramembrane metalloprotease [Nocardia sp. CA2R105]|uniref:CPBP family intramembrane glutamic endopeptidase n=1 Tax=Nocardia coffeae TaxID=2873381 RepID=UPI001CA7542D|nr:CPBP family intramembrane glutamic endopeptidase [Nocardia coffeae]MBY8857619.1 CPBP family intramembrane metalloprotease [Nocardia coffeae]